MQEEVPQSTVPHKIEHPTAATDHEGLLLLQRLETAVTKLGRGVDELEVDLLQSTAVGLHQQRLEEDNMVGEPEEPKSIVVIHCWLSLLTLRRVSTLFLVPTTQPFTMTKSFVTSP